MADLREPLAKADQALLAEEVARKLKADCPRYHTLMKLLHERGFLLK
ncbi:hypothetical protein [Schlesneria paludicola]|nr:hypothetical protein [Schlesneria paludicola]